MQKNIFTIVLVVMTLQFWKKTLYSFIFEIFTLPFAPSIHLFQYSLLYSPFLSHIPSRPFTHSLIYSFIFHHFLHLSFLLQNSTFLHKNLPDARVYPTCCCNLYGKNNWIPSNALVSPRKFEWSYKSLYLMPLLSTSGLMKEKDNRKSFIIFHVLGITIDSLTYHHLHHNHYIIIKIFTSNFSTTISTSTSSRCEQIKPYLYETQYWYTPPVLHLIGT